MKYNLKLSNLKLYNSIVRRKNDSFLDIIQDAFKVLHGCLTILPLSDNCWSPTAISAQGCSVHLALIEIDLEDMPSVEAVRMTRENFPDLPIMVITKHPVKALFLACIRAGANGYWINGVTESPLAHFIDLVIRGQHPICSSMAAYLFKFEALGIDADAHEKHGLSTRELELLKLLANGHTYARCAELMTVSLSTVQSHIRNLYRKLEVNNQRQAIQKAHATGIFKF